VANHRGAEYFEHVSTFSSRRRLCDLREERPMKMMWSAAIVIVGVSAAAGAQSGKELDRSMTGDRAPMMYTGCVESVNHGGTYLLTHLADDHQMAMGHDDKMKNESAMAMKNESASSDMHRDHMLPSSLVLAGPSDLKKHVGQKVTVTGAVSKGSMGGGMNDDIDTLTVGSLKVIGKSCK
jgi:hypothetical protein